MTKEEYKEKLDQDPFFTKKDTGTGIGVGGSQTIEYIPIQATRLTLEDIYSSYSTEIKEVVKDGNLIIVVARVHLTNPVTKEKFFVDGIGSQAYKMTAEYNISHAQGIQKAPLAYTNALKNAVQPLGRVFGRDLNDSKGFGDNAKKEVEKREFEISELDTFSKLAEMGGSYKTENKGIYTLITNRYKLLLSFFESGEEVEIKCDSANFDYTVSKKEYVEILKKREAKNASK